MNISRDKFLESYILFWDKMITERQKEENRKQKEVDKLLAHHYKVTESTEKKLRDILGNEDPTTVRFGMVDQIAYNLIGTRDSYYNHGGDSIDPDDISQCGGIYEEE